MNAPFRPVAVTVRRADLRDRGERRSLTSFVSAHRDATPFHRIEWLEAIEAGTGNPALALVAERAGELLAFVPLTQVHSPIFGRMLASSGFAVGGGVLAAEGFDPAPLFAELEVMAARVSCPTIELRGGVLPPSRRNWRVRSDSHCGFVGDLASNDEAQLLAIPRKQRAEVRKGLAADLSVAIGSSESDRAAHFAVYAESVRNLGTPVFPRALFDAVLDRFGADADILTVRYQGRPVASVLSLYHCGAVMPYWGGGTAAARHLRANDRMYFELMRHARARGCARFDFGRSKTGSGPYHFKRNWGFEPQPLVYASWSADGQAVRDADPTSARHAPLIAAWKRLPLPVANRLGPLIARGLG